MKWHFRNFSELCAVVYSLLTVFGGVVIADDDDLEACANQELIRCFEPLQIIHDGNKDFKFLANKEELDRMCPELELGMDCVVTYTKRCMKPEQQQQFNRLYRGTAEVLKDVCEDGSYQKEYLRHAPCVQKVRDEDENCAAKYQKELRDINQETLVTNTSQSESNKNVQKVCCSLQQYLDCSERAVLAACGAETADFTKAFLDKMASSLFQTHCEKYPAGSEECSLNNAVVPENGISHLFLIMASVLMFWLQQNRT